MYMDQVIHQDYLHLLTHNTIKSNIKVSTTQSGYYVRTSSRLHPYYTYKDLVLLIIFVQVITFILYYPLILSHPDNCIQADPLTTPNHIVPEWYYLPLYAILRAIPYKQGGVLTMVSTILVQLPQVWSHGTSLHSAKYRPLLRTLFWVFFFNFLFLMWLGCLPLDLPYLTLALISTLFHLSFFFLLIISSHFHTFTLDPHRITQHIAHS